MGLVGFWYPDAFIFYSQGYSIVYSCINVNLFTLAGILAGVGKQV